MISIVADLLDMFPHSVVIEPYLTSDGMGKRSYGAAVTWRARVKGQQKLVRDFAGVEKLSTVNVVFAGVPGVKAKDRYTLPVQFVPRQPKAISIDHSPDENGEHHERVYF
jgi:hypothetical protein